MENEIAYKCDSAINYIGDGKYKCTNGYTICDGCGNVFESSDKEYIQNFVAIDPKDVCMKGSAFGNYYLYLTDEDIESAKQGKILALLKEEYNFFVKYKGEPCNEQS